jgi:hypothetical protein
MFLGYKFLLVPKGKRMNTHQNAARPLALRNVDGRTVAARRYKAICGALSDDLGGQDKLSEPSKILVRQAAALSVELENLQSKIVAGEDVDTEQLVRLSNVQARALQRLGLKKPAPPRGPTLAELLAQPR